MGFEENEISKNANGGTEIAKRLLASRLPSDLLDNFQIISSRIRDLDDSKIRVLFLHDLPQDPESKRLADENYRSKFHKIVYISDWQYDQYRTILGVPYDTTGTVIETGIVPAVLEGEKPRDKIRICYTSTPHRGLNLLVPVFKNLYEKYPEIHLDVFSSFKLYGWEDADAQFEPLYQECREHPGITYHGAVSNQEIQDYLKTAHIFGYPCTWTETSCRSMIEAMSAKLVCVHPNRGALPFTSGNLNYMYQGDDNPQKHAALFHQALEQAIVDVRDNKKSMQDHLTFTKIYTDSRFNIDNAVRRWEATLRLLLEQYPTPESRAPKSEMFIYRT